MRNETPLNVPNIEVDLLGETLNRGGLVLPDNHTAFEKRFKGT